MRIAVLWLARERICEEITLMFHQSLSTQIFLRASNSIHVLRFVFISLYSKAR